MSSPVPLPQSERVTIRQFRPGDEDAFRTLNKLWIQRYFRIEPKNVEILSNPQGKIIDTGGHVFFAVLDGKIIGCCALIALNPAEFEIAKMAVADEERGHGIGRVLLSTVIEEARRAGARRLYLETNDLLRPAIHLYESLGFRPLDPALPMSSPYTRVNVYMELMLP